MIFQYYIRFQLKCSFAPKHNIMIQDMRILARRDEIIKSNWHFVRTVNEFYGEIKLYKTIHKINIKFHDRFTTHECIKDCKNLRISS